MDEPRQFKYITKEIVKEGSIEIHSTPEGMEKLTDVNLYNQYMKECRAKMQELKHIRNIYLVANIFVIFCIMMLTFASEMMFAQDNKFFIKFLVSIFLIVVYAAVYIYTSFWKNELEFFPNVLMTATFIFVDIKFLLLLIINIIICGLYRYKKGSLGAEFGYPLFYDIRIDRIRGKIYDTQMKVPIDLEIANKSSD